MDELSTPVLEAARQVEQAWQAAAERWQDETAARFEQEHMQPLADAAVDYIHAARELETILATLRGLAGDLA